MGSLERRSDGFFGSTGSLERRSDGFFTGSSALRSTKRRNLGKGNDLSVLFSHFRFKIWVQHGISTLRPVFGSCSVRQNGLWWHFAAPPYLGVPPVVVPFCRTTMARYLLVDPPARYLLVDGTQSFRHDICWSTGLRPSGTRFAGRRARRPTARDLMLGSVCISPEEP